MIFVDTNYFLRLILKDVSKQYEEAKETFNNGALGKVELFTSLIVIFEIYWVLESSYKTEKKDLIKALDDILALSFIQLDERDILKKALNLFAKENLSLEDCYNLSYAKTCGAREFRTFDAKLLKKF